MFILEWYGMHKEADVKTLYIEHEHWKTNHRVTIYLSDKDIGIVVHQLRVTSTTVEVVLDEWMQEAGI